MNSPHVRSGAPGSWPSPAEEELEDTISFDEWLGADREDSFIVQAPADLKEAGVLRGDMIVARRGRKFRAGDLIVVHGDSGLIVGRYGEFFAEDEMRLLGVVTAVVRKC